MLVSVLMEVPCLFLSYSVIAIFLTAAYLIYLIVKVTSPNQQRRERTLDSLRGDVTLTNITTFFTSAAASVSQNQFVIGLTS